MIIKRTHGANASGSIFRIAFGILLLAILLLQSNASAAITSTSAPTTTTFSVPTPPLTFPVPSVDSSGKNSFIGWLYRESTEGIIWGVNKNLNWIDGKGWIDKSEYHSGLDFWASPGTKVMGQATGKVIQVESGKRERKLRIALS